MAALNSQLVIGRALYVVCDVFQLVNSAGVWITKNWVLPSSLMRSAAGAQVDDIGANLYVATSVPDPPGEVASGSLIRVSFDLNGNVAGQPFSQVDPQVYRVCAWYAYSDPSWGGQSLIAVEGQKTGEIVMLWYGYDSYIVLNNNMYQGA